MALVSIYRPLGKQDRAAVCARVKIATHEWSSHWFQGLDFSIDEGVWRPSSATDTTSLAVLELNGAALLKGVTTTLRDRLLAWALDTTTATLRTSPPKTQEVLALLADRILDDLRKRLESVFGRGQADGADRSPKPDYHDNRLSCMDITVRGPDNTSLLTIRPCYAAVEPYLPSAAESPGSLASRQAALATTKINVTARLGGARLTLPDILDLSVGDVVKLDRATSDDIPLFVGNLTVATGTLHKIGDHIALQVI